MSWKEKWKLKLLDHWILSFHSNGNPLDKLGAISIVIQFVPWYCLLREILLWQFWFSKDSLDPYFIVLNTTNLSMIWWCCMICSSCALKFISLTNFNHPLSKLSASLFPIIRKHIYLLSLALISYESPLSIMVAPFKSNQNIGCLFLTIQYIEI